MNQQTTAKIIADTISKFGARITSFEVNAPRFLLAEINTHRVIARSAASSRAIPVKKRIDAIIDSPFVPAAFGKNQPGMQADHNLADDDNANAEKWWRYACRHAIKTARALSDIGVHKQHANRVLEPWAYYTGIMTATEWDNFFKLRTHPEAQPEFRQLAVIMRELYDSSTPRQHTEHLPYVPPGSMDNHSRDDRYAVSAARCARVSYKTRDGNPSTVEADISLCERLIASGHLSPFDHAATADVAFQGILGDEHHHEVVPSNKWWWRHPEGHRHFWGWMPERINVEEKLGMVCARSSFDDFTLDEPA